MERRFYSRLSVGINAAFIIRENEPGQREFSGEIVNVSENGIRIDFDYDDFAKIASTIEVGTKIIFQAVDDYVLYHDLVTDVIIGEVNVVRICDNDGIVTLGCNFTEVNRDFERYVANKRLSLFIGNKCAMA